MALSIRCKTLWVPIVVKCLAFEIRKYTSKYKKNGHHAQDQTANWMVSPNYSFPSLHKCDPHSISCQYQRSQSKCRVHQLMWSVPVLHISIGKDLKQANASPSTPEQPPVNVPGSDLLHLNEGCAIEIKLHREYAYIVTMFTQRWGLCWKCPTKLRALAYFNNVVVLKAGVGRS